MDFPTTFPEQHRHTPKQSWNSEINHKIINLGDVDDSFNSIYEIVNPQIMKENDINGENVTIAILDSGINEVGWITNLVGEYTTVSDSEQVDDNNGHGTLVGSIISKIAPAANLISIRVTDTTGFAEPEWVEKGLELALSLNASIIHASLGTSNLEAINSTIFSDLSQNNVSLVFSAGNEGPYASSLSSPAIFAETIAVGMVLNNTYLYPTSSSGPRPSGLLGPDLVAPGVEIVGYDHEGKVTNNTGSSFAAPFVTGALALLKEAFPYVSPITLKAALLETAHFINNTAQYINNASPIRQGNGLLDISKAYQRLLTIDTEPLLTFTPHTLSSDFPYYGHAINGVNRTYLIGLYSTINTTLTQINTSQEYPTSNVTQTLPFKVSAGPLPRNINVGLNYVNFSIFIPEDLNMAGRKGNVSFIFSNDTHENLWHSNLTIFIENRYPGGNILFYQGYDNDSFIPDGPTGSFCQLQHFLEGYYGMQSIGAIRPNELINVLDPLLATSRNSGEITTEDLKDKHILVLADIEFGISDQEIKLIQNWVEGGHSLLVLSYPSLIQNGTEILSNQSAINMLLAPYGLNIEDDPKNLSRFVQASTHISDPIFEEQGWEFNYIGTSIGISPEKGGKTLATAIDQSNDNEEYSIAGYWEDETSKGKVVVFGGMLPFDDLGIFLADEEDFAVITRIFRWMIQDQQASLEIILTSSPTIGGSTKIQITIKDSVFTEKYFNGTIIEANGSFSQIIFNKSTGMYLGSWKPLAAGQALLWLNLKIPEKVPTNGLIIFEVFDTSSDDIFLLLIIGSFVLLGVTYYLLVSRQTPKRSPIEQRVAFELQKRKKTPDHAGLDTFEICPQCQTSRYSKESKYCFKCGKEL